MILARLLIVCDNDGTEIADIVNPTCAAYALNDLMADGPQHLDHALVIKATFKEVDNKLAQVG